MNITEISIKRPSLIIVLFSVFTLLGFIGYKNLSYELMPDFNQPVVVIKTVYPGAEPNEHQYLFCHRYRCQWLYGGGRKNDHRGEHAYRSDQ